MSVNSYAKCMMGIMLSLALSPLAQAAVLYEQTLVTIDSFGFASNTGAGETADNFRVAASDVTDLRWYGSYFDPIGNGTDTFLISIYGDVNYSSVLYSDTSGSVSRSDSGFTDVFGGTIYEYNYTLGSPLSLSPGNYLLSVSNSNSLFTDWFWADSFDGDGTVYFDGDPTAWTPDDFNQIDVAFTVFGDLTATVPVPGSALLLINGLIGLLLLRRRRM